MSTIGKPNPFSDDCASSDPASSWDPDALWAWARGLPKIDLHRHLEGSLRLTTLIDLARTQGIELPAYEAEMLRPHVQMTDDPPDFQRFLDKFRILRRFYTSKEAVQRIAREVVADAAADNIVYLELRFNPLALAEEQSFTFDEVVEWVIEAVAEAERATGIRSCLILQIPRDEALSVANEVIDIAIEHLGRWVRGIDLAGNEAQYPPARFAVPFERAADAGLHITAHAGEALGAESVQATLLSLHPERIGHGIRAIVNVDVVRLLSQKGVALEVCPTSNLHTGTVRTLSEHPLPALFASKVRVTLNTDDPSVSGTTLTDEVVLAVRHLGVTSGMIYAMLHNALDAAFIPAEERSSLRDRIHRGLAAYTGAAELFASFNGILYSEGTAALQS